jgi:hypothetical protein
LGGSWGSLRIEARVPQQRREHGGEDRRGGVGLEIEGAEVGEDVGDIGGREHGNLLRWDGGR